MSKLVFGIYYMLQLIVVYNNQQDCLNIISWKSIYSLYLVSSPFLKKSQSSPFTLIKHTSFFPDSSIPWTNVANEFLHLIMMVSE